LKESILLITEITLFPDDTDDLDQFSDLLIERVHDYGVEMKETDQGDDWLQFTISFKDKLKNKETFIHWLEDKGLVIYYYTIISLSPLINMERFKIVKQYRENDLYYYVIGFNSFQEIKELEL
jgi:hypothetical protein